ncbi:SGNH hydrolase-type esterase domain-containing protein [Apiosordaria backusii]|uniref:SGNH hydrolase-type esterase domain-containing protein n=1 Tax=Apiosordaria backusii TaxID=314023 RepID=A0AA40EXV8_9PEZI|nr:SGNH hydrolase-type esterase domain-containing protein [Apiosordaria backusii]
MDPQPPHPLFAAMETLQAIAKYKQRSFETSLNSHVPLIEFSNASTSPEVVLIGDSMIERMLTTAHCGPNLVSSWPSKIMLTDEHGEQLQEGRVLNLGVGGDKIQNVAYRLVGDSAQGLRSVADMLAERKSVKLWVLQVGTNNLSAKKGLTEGDTDALKILVEALLEIGREDCRVLVTGLFLRRDISWDKIEKANESIQRVVGEISNGKPEGGEERVIWLPPTGEVKEDHLVDHVHLTEEGYKLWIGGSLAGEVAKVYKEFGGDH